MGSLYGLDCPFRECRHEHVTAYRLRIHVLRNKLCDHCGEPGRLQPRRDPISEDPIYNWYECCGCHAIGNNGKIQRHAWSIGWENERNDLIFRPNELDSAFAQMERLGDENPQIGKWTVITNPTRETAKLPREYDSRRLCLSQEEMPRTAIYFRWKPEAGQMLTPDAIFQCVFRADDDVPARQRAAEIKLTEEQCTVIVPGGEIRDGISSIQCQHCGRLLPLKTFSTITLREVEKGD